MSSPSELTDRCLGRRPRCAGKLVAVAIASAFAAYAAAPARAEAGEPPRRLVYEPGQPIPPGYHVEHRTRYGLVISGALLFAVTYLPTAAAAYYDGDDGTVLYVVPVLGPLLAIPNKTANHCTPSDHDPCLDFSGYVAAILIADALVQAGGLLMTWYGLRGRDLLIRDQATPQTRLVPGRVGTSGYGAWLVARF